MLDYTSNLKKDLKSYQKNKFKFMQIFIIEDDEWAIKALEKMINSYFTEITIIGTASNVLDSIQFITNKKPDLVLADIELENENVFEVIRKLGSGHDYNFVLTTSHEHFALEAISNEVIDYIIKPVTLEKLTTAINKVKRKLKKSNSDTNVNSNKEKNTGRMLGVASINKIEVINMDSIVYVQADGRYTHFVLLDGSKKTASKNLGEYEQLLPSEDFLRVHHSYMVNMNYVKSIIKLDGYSVELFKSKVFIPVSKRKQEAVSNFLKLKG